MGEGTNSIVAGSSASQALIDAAVMGVLGKSKEWLAIVVGSPELINAISSMGMTPLFVACYALWLPGVKQLLAAGAEVRPAAFEAVRLGQEDWVEAPVVVAGPRFAGLIMRALLATQRGYEEVRAA